MMIAAGMVALAEGFRDATSGPQVLDALEDLFRSFGATHFLVTGFPLPGRPIEPLVIRMTWGDLRPDRPGGLLLRGDDPVLHRVLGAKRPFTWLDSLKEISASESPLLTGLGASHEMRMIAVPICAFLPYQAVVIAGGPAPVIDLRSLLAVDYICVEAFRRLLALGFVKPERPGELSARERRVVELSASGKTANEIASILVISQRTVHAHLQNASGKLVPTTRPTPLSRRCAMARFRSG